MLFLSNKGKFLIKNKVNFFLGKNKEIFIKLTNLREYAIINNFYK